MGKRAKISAKKSEAKKENSVSRIRKTDYSQSFSSPIDHILFLQRTIGNQVVQKLFNTGVIQAKLKIGQPNDIYEQEADRVADEVMRMPEPQVQRQSKVEEEEELVQTKPIGDQITPFVQRQVEPEEEEEEELIQTKPLAEQITPLVQRQVEEEELLQTKSLAQTLTPLIQRQAEPRKKRRIPIQAKPTGDIQLQRQEAEPEEEEEMLQAKSVYGAQLQHQEEPVEEEHLMAKGISGKSQHIRDDLHIRLNRNGGQPLPEADRNFMERRFSSNFSEVRLHMDSNAIQMNKELNAQAFTHGRNIYFGAGRYRPGASSGKRLLAHELTHVIQQGGITRKKLIGHELTHVMQQNKGTSNPSMIVQRRSRRGRRGPGARPIPSTIPPDVIRNLKNLIQGRGGGRGRRRRGGSLPPEFESRWERREAKRIETGVGIHIQIINNYHRVSGVSGTVGKAKTPAQAAAGALKFIMEGAAVVSKIPENTELLVVLTDLKKAYLPVIDDWKSLLPESEYQLYTIVHTNPVLMYEIPIVITTNKHLAKEILKEMGEPEWYSIKLYGKIWGQVILPTPEGPEYPVIKSANE